jgi:hypothetical protein
MVSAKAPTMSQSSSPMVMAVVVILSIFLASMAFAAAEEVIQQVSANGSRNLPPFTVKDGWEVRWDFTGSDSGITIFIHDVSSGNPIEIAASQTKAGSGSSYQAKGGKYYLKVTAVGDWTISVVQLP